MDWKFITVEQEITVGLAAYAALDVVGGLLTFAIPATVNGGILNAVSLFDEDNQKEAYNLYLHDSEPATIADDATYGVAIADLRRQFAVVAIAAGDYTTVNSLAYAHKTGLDYVFQADGKNQIYAYLEAVLTPDYTVTDALFIRLHIRTLGV